MTTLRGMSIVILHVSVLRNLGYRDGTCVRDYLHVMDLASGHLLALEALAPQSTIFAGCSEVNFKAYNLGKGRGVSVLQIVDAMRKATGFDFKCEIIGRRCVFLNQILVISKYIFWQTWRCA
jgi:UDP-glucose 4-epimerase